MSWGTFIEETTPRFQMRKSQETQPTLGFQRVLQRAMFHVQSSGKNGSDWGKCIGRYF